MKIEVGKIPESGMIVEEEESPQIMKEGPDDVQYNDKIRVRVSVNVVGRTLVIHGRIATKAVLECNRCLKEFDHQVDVRDYTFAREVRRDETVDLTDSIREDIMLAIPMKRLCIAECKGICPICGQDRNISPCDCRKSQDATPFPGLEGLKP